MSVFRIKLAVFDRRSIRSRRVWPVKREPDKAEKKCLLLTTAESDMRVGVGLFGHAGYPKVGVGTASEPDGRGARARGEAHLLFVAERG